MRGAVKYNSLYVLVPGFKKQRNPVVSAFLQFFASESCLLNSATTYFV